MEGRQAAIWGIQELGGGMGSSDGMGSSCQNNIQSNMQSGMNNNNNNTDCMGASSSTSSTLHTHNSATHVLGNAVVLRAKILQEKCTFKVPIGVTVSCLPSNETTASGESYCYTVLPESTSSVPIVLFESSEENENGNRWR